MSCPEPRFSTDLADYDEVVVYRQHKESWHVPDENGDPVCGGPNAAKGIGSGIYRLRDAQAIPDRLDPCRNCMGTADRGRGKQGPQLCSKLAKMGPEDLGLEGPP